MHSLPLSGLQNENDALRLEPAAHRAAGFPSNCLGAGGQLLEIWHMVCITMRSRKKVDRNAQFGARISLTIPPLLTDRIGGNRRDSTGPREKKVHGVSPDKQRVVRAAGLDERISMTKPWLRAVGNPISHPQANANGSDRAANNERNKAP
jgi:hypothetical protein